MPSLRLIAGPNGSGKTTLTDELRQRFEVPLGQYTNPDEIEKSLVDIIEDKLSRSRIAQKISKDQREKWLIDGISHSYESVMSHESHLDFIRKANQRGFKTYLYYVCINDPEINCDRVDERVISGGHPVPKEKILSRYQRSLEQLCEMALLCRRVYFFDNTDKLTSFAEININGYLDIKEKLYYELEPHWFREHVLMKWDKSKVRIIR
ncbi:MULTISPECIES: zeta toxin family protein [Colwellia]|uniref:ATPase AAA n=1 Tax=Colwellia marinimaniae TaxID=1513592 RepID=A0ABQ0MVR9_9GAMM|nr:MULTISPECIES: zeta toxin family protein [Colwellia]GAW96470.1 ATPase AAA [Colwellia marinimaniae]